MKKTNFYNFFTFSAEEKIEENKFDEKIEEKKLMTIFLIFDEKICSKLPTFLQIF
jgi:hypothetical protein